MPYLICYMEHDTLKYENPKIKKELLIYPNPASKTITIEHNGQLLVEVYDIYDQMNIAIKKDAINRTYIYIYISELSSGIYISCN
ncbi:MAG: hypothetical protein Kow0068_13230 [Marinilabiliales bacterium]